MTRKSRNIKPRQAARENFAFIIDGKCEYWYIQLLKRNEPHLRIKVSPEIPKRKTLFECFNNAKELAQDYSVIFWIVDFDAILKEAREAPAGKRETSLQEFKRYYDCLKEEHTNVIIILNNPCLEYWYLLHFKSTNKYFRDYDSLKPTLLKYIPGYEKTQKFYFQANDIYKRLKPLLTAAVANSKRIGEIDFDTPVGMSQMHLLFEAQIESKMILDMLS